MAPPGSLMCMKIAIFMAMTGENEKALGSGATRPSHQPFHGGNRDAPEMCPCNTAYFPVNVPGALLHLGDGHAAQGDGEVSAWWWKSPPRGLLR